MEEPEDPINPIILDEESPLYSQAVKNTAKPVSFDFTDSDFPPIPIQLKLQQRNKRPRTSTAHTAATNMPNDRTSIDQGLRDKEASLPIKAVPELGSYKEAISYAQTVLIKAASLAPDTKVQTAVLNMIDIFRKFLDEEKIQQNVVLQNQISNLDMSVKTLARRATNYLPHTQSTKPTSQPTAKQPPKTPTLTKRPAKEPQQLSVRSRQIVLLRAIGVPINPLEVRNKINQAFINTKTIAGPVLATVQKAATSNNIILTTTAQFNAEWLLEHKAIWAPFLHFSTAQLNQPWYKVVVHGLPLKDDNSEDNLPNISPELSMYNPGFHPVGNPYWLTSKAKRESGQSQGSAIVSFKTEEEAKRAISKGLFMFAMKSRVEKFEQIPFSTQCSHCLAYGHLAAKCTKSPNCKFCGKDHTSSQHLCTICSAKGKSCQHTILECSNCTEQHRGDSKMCEVYLATRPKTWSYGQQNQQHSTFPAADAGITFPPASGAQPEFNPASQLQQTSTDQW